VPADLKTNVKQLVAGHATGIQVSNFPRECERTIGKGTPLKDTFIKIGFKKLTDFLRACDDVIEVQDNGGSVACFPKFSTTSAAIQPDYTERLKKQEVPKREGTERMKEGEIIAEIEEGEMIEGEIACQIHRDTVCGCRRRTSKLAKYTGRIMRCRGQRGGRQREARLWCSKLRGMHQILQDQEGTLVCHYGFPA
jgi:hypothetical protein